MDWTCGKESSVIKKEFRREAVYQLCREWGGTFAPSFLEKMAEDCDIHHIRPQFLGGPDSVENFCLMDKKTHQALHNHFKKQLKILAAAKARLMDSSRACTLHSEKDILWNILRTRDNEPAPLVPIYWPEGMCHIHELHGLHGRAASHPALTQ
ncbi:MAG: hypothetical protein KGI37_03815 [Alphaproteobacteria bacterium]|nr:hypothetical protein [Alphaproteobacteria bacterium]